jgi:hypothetical protein
MEVVKMKCMKAMFGVTIIDRVRNEDICRRCGSEVSIVEKINRNMLRWHSLVKRMEDERIVKRVYSGKVEGSRARRKPKMRLMDMDSVKASVKKTNIKDARKGGQDFGAWRRIVNS